MAIERRNVANCELRFWEHTVAKRIAIVEDEAAIRDNYTDAFRREGYVVDAYEARMREQRPWLFSGVAGEVNS